MFKARITHALDIIQVLTESNVYAESAVTAVELGEATGFCLSYMEQLLSPLRRAGIVKGTRGPHGGYVLIRPIEEIYLLDIANVFYADEIKYMVNPTLEVLFREMLQKVEELPDD